MNSFVFAFFLVAAIASLVTRWLARSPSTSGHIRENYVNSWIPLALRNSVALAPLYALASLFTSASLAMSPTINLWLVLAALLCFEIGVVMSYRVPAPFLPGWMKREIAEGSLEAARPNRLDRPLLWIFLTVSTFVEAVILIKVAGII